MTPASKDIEIRLGDSKELFIRIRSRIWDSASSTYIPGDYIDITGWTILSQIRITSEDASPLLTFTSTIYPQATTPGGFSLKLTATQTGGLARNLTSGVWDCQITESSGDVNTYVAGNVTFVKDVSRVG